MDLQITTTKIWNDLEVDKRILVLRGGTRSSKSYTTMLWCIVYALANPNTTISVVRKSLPSLKKSIYRDFKTIMTNLNIWNDKEYLATEMSYYYYNGSIIEFFSVADEQRIRGSQRNILFCDEANELTHDEFFQLNIRTSLKTILAFNPSFNPTTHWIYNKVLTRDDAVEFISTYRDNPFIPQTIIDEIEKLKETSPSLYKIYSEGLFGNVEGLVYDNFNLIDEIPEEVELLGYGQDYGFSNDETTLVALFKWNDFIIAHELLYKKGLLTNDIANEILNNYKIYGVKHVIGDSADPRMIKELSLVRGVQIFSADKGPDSIRKGIDIIKGHKLLITKSSTNLINEIYNYVWKKDKEGNVTNVPTGKDHLLDALRYIASYTLSNNKKSYGKYSFSFL